jgi:hypothetical protein
VPSSRVGAAAAAQTPRSAPVSRQPASFRCPDAPSWPAACTPSAYIEIVRNEKAEKSPTIVIPNHRSGATGGSMAKMPSIETASRTTPMATAIPRLAFSRADSQPRSGSCTTSNSRSANSTPANAVSPTP